MLSLNSAIDVQGYHIIITCVLILVTRAPTYNYQTGGCSSHSIFMYIFICHLAVTTNIAIYAINETQIYTSGVYTNYYRGYKYPSSCPTNRYGPACLYQCNCDPENCHIVLGCTDSDPSAELSEIGRAHV